MQVCYSSYIHSRNETERCPDSEKHFSLNYDQAHKLMGIIGGANVKRTHLSTWEDDI